MKAKEQALDALSTIRKMIESPDPLVGVRLVQVRGLVEYAETQVTEIQEVKRTRKEKGGA